MQDQLMFLVAGVHITPIPAAAITAGIVLLLYSVLQALFVARKYKNGTLSGNSTPGKWIPQEFKRPDPAPYPDWDIETTKPIPYRPFRYGPKFYQTMGLRMAPWDEWIELDSDYPKYHARKAERILERGSKCSRSSPEGYPAAVELLEELCSYLPQRYPTLYREVGDGGIENLWSGETFDITARPLPEDPMQIVARLVQDDISVMVPRAVDSADGSSSSAAFTYYLLAGSVLLAGFWRLEDKFGLSLQDIHLAGAVPQYQEKLERGMLNLFRRMRPQDLFVRNAYFVQTDTDMAWSTAFGDEDAAGELSWDAAAVSTVDGVAAHHHLRVERQTLRRLPRTGAVVFGVRTYFHSVAELAQEDYVPGRLASAIRSWGDDIGRYKGREKYGDALLAYLDKKHDEQLARGLDLGREEDVRKFPF